ncbi:MAG TPA: lytic transglycosylase domain-containing protein [bacterium]|jgi:soluble lytic murein transglycosylase|nr:lytic transglycosylase domain-containing protein [bacterium]HNT64723.1 lytic transglycosylase domain-containing protein [bacterium]HOX85884.1 lytic transglycosylase domain-containing protein [bacterium]HPG45133.1 lytic transglycosylase domain-containing protein [bacterium]HPM97375.1 lytic transglycosylase domain-containing protein [bacterium]
MDKKVKKSFSFTRYLVFTLFFVLVIAIVAAALRHMYNKQNAFRIAQMEKMIYDLQSSIQVDSIRQYQIQKIMAIINQYNTSLPHHKKYEIAEEIFRMSEKYPTLNVDLLCATITHETGGTWDTEAVSPAGAMGLMQVMPTTGMFVATYEDLTWSSPEEILFNPIYNIRIGSRYLASLIEMYDVEGGLAAYNGGERRAALWLGSGKAYGVLAGETQNYIPAVKRLYEEFQSFTM